MRSRFVAHFVGAFVFIASNCAVGLTANGAGAVRPAEHVIHISVDAMNARLLQQLIDAGCAPNIKRFQDEGVWTLNGRTDYTHTNTLPNHTCMLTGRPVERPMGMPATVPHGWTINYLPRRSSTLHKDGNARARYIASVFDVVHDAGLTTALYAGKSKFEVYDLSYNEINGANNPHGRDKIDEFATEDDDPPLLSNTLNERFLADMATYHFNYVFLHYRDADSFGHDMGWGSAVWFYALKNVDAYIGKVLHLVETDPELAGRTAIILNTDHGGSGYGHITPTVRENYTIPIMAWGAGVGHGELYSLNRGRRTDPGDARPDYTASPQPIRNGETGNLALSLLGLGPIPGSLMNATQDLSVASEGDFNQDGSVDAADYVLLRKAESSQNLRADANGDGHVDEADDKLWQAKFGKPAGKGQSAAPAE